MTINNINSIKSFVIFILILCYNNDSSAQQKPNIVLFLVDDMGVMDTSVPFIADSTNTVTAFPLNKFYKTPNMARLAKKGIRFSNAYAMSVCSPSRATIMTGKNPANHKITQWIDPFKKNSSAYDPNWRWTGLNSTDITLPQLLQKQGYKTIHIGKGHFGPQGEASELITPLGFDVNIAGSSIGRPSSYEGTDNFGGTLNEARKKRAVPGLKQYHGKDIFLTEALTLELKKAINSSVEEKRPFFVYMSHYAVHAPFMKDKRFNELYPKNTPLDKFASMIAGMDKSLGDLMNHLESINQAENTLIIFLGDNGTASPIGDKDAISCSAPLRGKKGTFWEGGTRVPFIVAWAKTNKKNKFQKSTPILEGTIDTEKIVSIEDVLPTIMDIVKAPKIHNIDGRSIVPYLNGNEDPENDQTFLMHFPHKHKSSYYTTYRKEDWKVIYQYKKNGTEKYILFNLKKDSSESHNMAASNPEILKELLAEMKIKLTNWNAQYPLDDTKHSFEEIIAPN